MRQVPLTKPFFALVGQGRVGRALAAYLSARELPYRVFAREDYYSKITESADEIQSVLLAVSDPAIASIVAELRDISRLKAPILHFSASVRVEGAVGFHPLASFTSRSLTLEDFEKIPFVANPGEAPLFKKIFPDFINPVVEIDRARDARYHALCVLLGNIPLVIQDLAARSLQKDYGLSREACLPFLKSLLANFEMSDTSETQSLVAGPVARRDRLTTTLHLEALENHGLLKSFYELFVDKTWPDYRKTELEENK